MKFTRNYIDKTEVYTIIGSTRFKDKMEEEAALLQSFGYLSLVTSISKDVRTDLIVSEHNLMKEGYKRIDLSNQVVCINYNGYIGENTAREYQYATLIKRIPVSFKYDKVSESLLKYLNSYYEDYDGKLHLWNISDNSLVNIKTIYVRKNLVIDKDILDLLEELNFDRNCYNFILISNMICESKYINNNILSVDDDTFENQIRSSDLFVTE